MGETSPRSLTGWSSWTPTFSCTHTIGRQARHERAAQLVGALGADRRGAISIQVLQEFYVNVTRKIAEPLNPGVAVDRLRVLRCWPLHVPQGDDVIEAAELAHRGQVSFWDAMIIRSAAMLGCLVLWSEDLSHGQCIDGVTVRNPFLP